jgi:hypothetical protein
MTGSADDCNDSLNRLHIQRLFKYKPIYSLPYCLLTSPQIQSLQNEKTLTLVCRTLSPMAQLHRGNYFYRIQNKAGPMLTVGGVVKR